MTGTTCSNTASSSLPHITVSCPFSAPACPPDTGASTKPTLRSAQAPASSRASPADAVVWSTSTVPGRIVASDAVLAEHHLADVVVVADAHHHDVGVLGGLGRRRRRSVPVERHPGERLGRRAVVDGDRVAGACDVACHRRPHHTHAEERHPVNGPDVRGIDGRLGGGATRRS